jgi:hypothetical protein
MHRFWTKPLTLARDPIPGPLLDRLGLNPCRELVDPNTMQVIRGTRAPFLAAACAMLIIGTGASDSPAATTEFYLSASAYFISPNGGGPDGCPVSPSVFDPRELCSSDLGADWFPVYGQVLQLCPPGPTVFYGAIQNSTMTVIERITTEPDEASAIAVIRDRVRCVLNTKSEILGATRALPAIAIPGTTAEAQVVTDAPRDMRGGEVATLVAIGPDIVGIGVSAYGSLPDTATVMRIVDAAVHRFQNPRPSGGPFAPVVGHEPVVSPAPELLPRR